MFVEKDTDAEKAADGYEATMSGDGGDGGERLEGVGGEKSGARRGGTEGGSEDGMSELSQELRDGCAIKQATSTLAKNERIQASRGPPDGTGP